MNIRRLPLFWMVIFFCVHIFLLISVCNFLQIVIEMQQFIVMTKSGLLCKFPQAVMYGSGPTMNVSMLNHPSPWLPMGKGRQPPPPLDPLAVMHKEHVGEYFQPKQKIDGRGMWNPSVTTSLVQKQFTERLVLGRLPPAVQTILLLPRHVMVKKSKKN